MVGRGEWQMRGEPVLFVVSLSLTLFCGVEGGGWMGVGVYGVSEK